MLYVFKIVFKITLKNALIWRQMKHKYAQGVSTIKQESYPNLIWHCASIIQCISSQTGMDIRILALEWSDRQQRFKFISHVYKDTDDI